MDYGRTIEVHQNEIESESAIEQLKRPYAFAMEDNWEGLKQYYQMNPQDLNSPMTVQGDTAIHIAASCSTGSEGKQVLEFLINSLMSTYEEKCYALRLPNNNGNNALHQVALSGDREAAEFLVSHFNKPAQDITCTDDENATLPLLETRNHLGETPLYRAAALGPNSDLVKFYANKLKENPGNLSSHFHRNDKMSILHIAVISQHFETALWLQKNYPHLAQLTEDKGLTSLQLLAQMPTAFVPEFRTSRWKMLVYNFYNVNNSLMAGRYTLPYMLKCFTCISSCCNARLPDLDGDLVTPNQKDDVESSLDSNQPRQSPSRTKLAGTGGPESIITKIWKEKKNQKSLAKLITLLIKQDYSWEKSNYKAKTKTISLGSVENLINDGDPEGENGKGDAEPTKSDKRLKVYKYTPLLIATITGIVPIVKEILEQHPQAVEHVSYHEQTILHLCIKHRRKEILEHIESKPTMMSRLKEGIDADGNTILHQAADRSYYSIAVSQKLTGPVMQLQEELLWMQRVKKMAPPHYTMHHNSKEQTAEEVFNAQHEELLRAAQEWIKDTAESCSTVAVLVATVVFAAAYAIPGGNTENGRPVFQDSSLFWLFTSMDVLAISCSLSSVAFFLSIQSSPLEYPYFCRSLPRKLMIGFFLLFLSMATTMLAFAATILLLVRVEKKLTKSILYPVAFLPVPLFGLLQFPMYHSFKVKSQTIAKILRPFLLPFLGFCKRSVHGKTKAR